MKNKIKSPKAAVLGDPISHSLSPTIHRFLLEKHGLKGSYEAIKVEKSQLNTTIDSLINEEFAGFNITIPHKENIFQICDYKSKTALLTKAVNTVRITKDNKLFGHNSDAEGFINNLNYSQKNFILKNKTAFVIGAGGAARAIIYSLIKSEVKTIYINNRNQSRANELIHDFKDFAIEKNCTLSLLTNQDFANQLHECDFLVNSTSLGMVGQEKLSIDLTHLNKEAVIYDIVYKPLMTDLLIAAQNRGNKIVTGIGMLIFQALVGFELWYAQKPEEKFIQELFEHLDHLNSY